MDQHPNAWTPQPLVAAALLVAFAFAPSASAQGKLHHATENGSLRAVQRFLESGSDVDERDRHGRTALFVAAERGFSAIVDALLEAGADVDAENEFGYTPLMLAAFGGQTQIVERLLASGARVDRSARTGLTAMHGAAGAGDERSIELLLAAASDERVADRKDDRHRTPLMYAAASGSVPAIDALLAAGADPDVESKDDYTALELARLYGHRAATGRLGGSYDVIEAGPRKRWRMDEVEDRTRPTLDRRTEPEYTADAVGRRLEGVVLLDVVIEPNGRISTVRVLEPLDLSLDLEAIDCIREWRFTPARLDGEDIAVIAEIEVSFALVP